MAFFGRNSTRIEEAKQAEARLQNIPLPIGSSGTVIVTGFKFDKSKNKTNPDGSTKEGTPYCEMTFSVVDHDAHQGKTLRKQWWFASSANMDAAGRYEMFLNDLERLGMPRELRTNHESPAELGSYFLDQQGLAFHFQIVENPRNTLDDGKEIRLSTIEDHVPQDDSVVPPSMMSAPKDPAAVAATTPAPAQTTAAPSPESPTAQNNLPAVKSKVSHLGMEWIVEEVFADSGKVLLKNIDDPRMERITTVDKLD